MYIYICVTWLIWRVNWYDVTWLNQCDLHRGIFLSVIYIYIYIYIRVTWLIQCDYRGIFLRVIYRYIYFYIRATWLIQCDLYRGILPTCDVTHLTWLIFLRWVIYIHIYTYTYTYIYIYVWLDAYSVTYIEALCLLVTWLIWRDLSFWDEWYIYIEIYIYISTCDMTHPVWFIPRHFAYVWRESSMGWLRLVGSIQL